MMRMRAGLGSGQGRGPLAHDRYSARPGAIRAGGLLGRLTWLAGQILSFETIFALYFYSNAIKFVLPELPGDETVIFAAMSMAVGGAVILRQGIYLRGLPVVAAGLLLIGWAALSWGWSPSRVLAAKYLSFLFTFNLWCLITGALVLAPSRERTIRFLAILLALSTLISLYGIFIYLYYGNFRFFSGFAGMGRMYLNWGYPAANGAIIAFCWMIFSPYLSLRQLAAAVLCGVCTGFLLVGSGRGPLLGVIVAFLFAGMAGLPRVGRGRIDVPRWQILGVGAVALVGAYLAYLEMSGVSIATFGRFAKLFAEAQNPDVIEGPNRFRYYAAALRFWLESPVIGNGIASFSLMFAGFEQVGAQPHNIVLEMLTELGLVGLALLMFFLWSGIRLGLGGRLRHDPVLLCIAMLLAARVLAAMISAEIAGQSPLFLLVGMMAIRPLVQPAAAGLPGMRRRPGRLAA
ncbi:MAG TPA: O-antigen ligase family protein [Geminicoccaceae bacterium]|nr:O-antigen ligase family protein [Geminicoccus sp.]HMU50776.1 O-antigen ligase family protein [Geminicoccaceae bacterium]